MFPHTCTQLVCFTSVCTVSCCSSSRPAKAHYSILTVPSCSGMVRRVQLMERWCFPQSFEVERMVDPVRVTVCFHRCADRDFEVLLMYGRHVQHEYCLYAIYAEYFGRYLCVDRVVNQLRTGGLPLTVVTCNIQLTCSWSLFSAIGRMTFSPMSTDTLTVLDMSSSVEPITTPYSTRSLS